MATARKPKIVKPTIVESETTVLGENPNKTWAARIDEFMTEHLSIAGVCGWKRSLMAWIGGALTALGVGYLVGQVTSILMVAALLGTGSLFLTYLVLALGFVASYYVGGKLGFAVFRGIATGDWELATTNLGLGGWKHV